MVMAWRFGAVGVDAVMAVIQDPSTFADWMAGVPPQVRASPNWPQKGSVVQRYDGQEPRMRHAQNRHLTVALVERWRPEDELILRLRSGLGGWVRIWISVHARPGGAIIEVRAEPLSATARLRFSSSSRNAEERCAQVAERLIELATTEPVEED
ncbi:hypothetical protein [Kribbella sp. NPDC004536]|uniref:hypothetical protein n=1 Tax=Kribbella sp. NPDC004536 TaxID=3364106 RepID=UPI0036779A01